MQLGKWDSGEVSLYKKSIATLEKASERTGSQAGDGLEHVMCKEMPRAASAQPREGKA